MSNITIPIQEEKVRLRRAAKVMQKISARQPKVMRELWKTSIKDRVVRREQRAVRSTHNVGALC